MTVEDCLDRIPNQFELTLVAAKRARQLARGAEAKLPWGNHKSTVLSLKEIAHGYIDTGVTLIAGKAVAGVDSKDVKVGTDLCWGNK